MYTGRILLGSRPAYLPALQSARIEMGLNLKAAKALGIEVPTATRPLFVATRLADKPEPARSMLRRCRDPPAMWDAGRRAS